MTLRRKLIILFAVLLMLLTFSGQAWAGTWENISPPSGITQINDLVTAQDGSICIATNNGVYKRNGSSWSALPPIPSPDVRSIDIDFNGVIFIGCSDGKVYKLEGSAWVDTGATGLTSVIDLEISADNTVWALHSSKVVKNNGSGWVVVKSTPYKNSRSYESWYAIATNSIGTIVLGADDGCFSISNDQGNSWLNYSSCFDTTISSSSSYYDSPDNMLYLGNTFYVSASDSIGINVPPYVTCFNDSLGIGGLVVLPDGKLGASGNEFYKISGTSITSTGTSGGSLKMAVAGDGSVWSVSGTSITRYTGTVRLTSITSVSQTGFTVNYNYDSSSPFVAKIQLSTDNATWTDYMPAGSTSSYSISGLQPATRYYVRVGFYNKYSKTWNYTNSSSVTTVPATPQAPTGITGGVSWSNDINNPGRSYVVLNWTPTAGASGYKVWMFDGYAYRMVQDVGNTTTWDSRTARIFPSEETLDAITDNTSTSNLFVSPTTGYDLPDRPWKLYKKTSGITYDSNSNYWFRVSAYNSSGESGQSDAYMPTLPDRTDTVAPTGSMIINDGAYNTSDRNVTIAITGSDDKSGLYQMQFSSDNISWTSWDSFATSKTYQIGTGGQQTVYMKLKDAAGNVSNIISQSIFFINDTEPPTVSVKLANGSAQTTSGTIDISITAQDNLNTPDKLLMRASLDGSTWYTYDGIGTWTAASGWGPYTALTHNFSLGSTGGQKYVYIQVKDPAGNVANCTSTIFYVTEAVQPTTATFAPVANATWGTAVNGSYVTVDGSAMMVVQGNTAAITLTGISNSTKFLTSFDGVNWSQPDAIPSGTSSITKTVTFAQQGKNTLNVKLINDYGVESPVITRYYLVDYTPPTIDVKTASGATLTSGSSINLFIKAQDNVSTRVAYRINSSAWNVLPADGIVSSGTLSSGRNQLNIQVVDEAGNIAQGVVNVWKN